MHLLYSLQCRGLASRRSGSKFSDRFVFSGVSYEPRIDNRAVRVARLAASIITIVLNHAAVSCGSKSAAPEKLFGGGS